MLNVNMLNKLLPNITIVYSMVNSCMLAANKPHLNLHLQSPNRKASFNNQQKTLGKTFFFSHLSSLDLSLRTSSNASSTSHQPLKLSTSTGSSSSSASSNKITIDPNFFRQALFHPTNNSSNPVQFQVKL